MPPVHDYVIDNSTGANVRADINSVLQAILTNNSSSSAPSTTAAYMWWADTTNGVLKIRNSANNAWVELLQLDGTLTLEDGAVGTPALAFRDDLNTGIFSSAADTFNVATGGVERLELGTETIFNEDGADVDFRIEGDTDENLFRIDAGNDRVGIGTSSPSTLLELSGGGNTTLTLNTGNNSGDNSQIAFGDSADADVGFINYDHGTNALQFRVNASERFRVDSIGNFLVGASSSIEVASSAEAQLQVTQASDGSRLGLSLISIFDGAGPAAVLALGHGRGSTSGALQDNDVIGQIRFAGGDGTDCQTIAGSIDCEIDGTPSSNNMPAALTFNTNSGGASTSERMRIDSSGHMLFQTSSTTGTGIMFLTNPTSPYPRIAHSGSDSNFANHTLVEFRVAGGSVIGEIKQDGDGTITYATSSDYRLKENIFDLTGAITRLKNLKPRRFNFKKNPSLTKDGFLAHELQEVIPEAVNGTKDEVVTEDSKANIPQLADEEVGNPVYQTADLARVVPLLTAALQELVTRVETLESA